VVLSDLVTGFDRYIRAVDPEAAWNEAPPTANLNHTVWDVSGTAKAYGDNTPRETTLLVTVRRFVTRYTDGNNNGGMVDKVVDALYSAFNTETVNSTYNVDRDDKGECVIHTWFVEFQEPQAATEPTGWL